MKTGIGFYIKLGAVFMGALIFLSFTNQVWAESNSPPPLVALIEPEENALIISKKPFVNKNWPRAA